jgi:hypothetical protein
MVTVPPLKTISALSKRGVQTKSTVELMTTRMPWAWTFRLRLMVRWEPSMVRVIPPWTRRFCSTYPVLPLNSVFTVMSQSPWAGGVPGTAETRAAMTATAARATSTSSAYLRGGLITSILCAPA